VREEAAGMEATKSGDASAAPGPMAATSTAAAAAQPPPTAPTVGFQSPPPFAATAERGSSSGVLVSPPTVGGGAVVRVAKKRGRPRKYGPDGSLIRPLNATPISASAPMMASGMAMGQYTPASAVGAAMKRGTGRPIDFSAVGNKPHQQQFGFHFDSIGTPSFRPQFCLHEIRLLFQEKKFSLSLLLSSSLQINYLRD
jgi:hypothetical protein